MNFFNDFDVAPTIDKLGLNGACVIQKFLTEETRKSLLRELSGMQLDPQPKIYGTRKAVQNFKATWEIKFDGIFVAVKNALENFLNEKFFGYRPYVLSEPLRFNDTMITTYKPCDVGISIHKDPAQFINLVVILVLRGHGDFYVYSDDEGNNPVLQENIPGDMIMMTAPGFLGKKNQPNHSIGNIRTLRSVYGLRHRKKNI